MPAARSASDSRLYGIQALRALAALMVVAYHVEPRLARAGWVGHWPGSLSAGVDIFFVVSGFIMWFTTRGGRVRPGAFLLRRVERIVPLYAVFTTLFLGVLLAAPALVAGGRFDPGHALASLLFLPARHPLTGNWEPVLPQGWTLNLEMAFYVLFALGLMLPQRARLGFLLGALGLAALAGGLVGPTGTALDLYASGIVLEFGFGVAVAAAFRRGLTLPRPLSLGLLAVGVALIAASDLWMTPEMPRALIWGVPAAAIVAGTVFAERGGLVLRNSLAQRLGDASYAIYLSHGFALTGVAVAWSRLGWMAPVRHLPALLVVSLLAAAAFGTLAHRAVEAPLGRWLKRRGRVPAPGPALATAG